MPSFYQEQKGRMEAALAAYPTQAQAFIALLTADDHNSFYILSSDASGTWADTALRRGQLQQLRFSAGHSYYLTHNGFSGKHRRTQETRQLNALFYDLDCHGSSQFECRRLVAQALQRIEQAVDQGVLPQPTMIVDSGRGLHLYYVLRRSIPCYVKSGSALVPNEKSLSYFRDVQERLAGVVEGIIGGLDGLELDRAVFDHTRVARIPGTYNAKAGRYAQLVGGSYQPCELGELAALCPRKQPSPTAPIGANSQVIRFNRLMMTRLRKVAQLQEHRGFACHGTRELMAFVYYNTAVQIYERSAAAERLAAFNARFLEPLPQAELDNIVRAVDGVTNVKGQKGHYILSASTLTRLLSLTQSEIDELQFFSSRRVAERAEAKLATSRRRTERNRRICELYTSGQMTQQQVADAVGCSVRTVFTGLKANGLAGRSAKPQVSAAVPHKATQTMQRRGVAFAAVRHRFPQGILASTRARYTAAPQSEILWHTCLGVVQPDAPMALESSAPVVFERSFAPIVRVSHVKRRDSFKLPLPYFTQLQFSFG